jgi:hypothetical protein
MQTFKLIMRRWAVLVLAGLLLCVGDGATAGSEWLARCAQCVNPGIVSKSGVGTANAVAEARITRGDVEGWCASWRPDDKACVKQQLTGEDLKKVYRAKANCSTGSFTPIDGKTYKLSGVWDASDIGAGRSRWRDASGKVVPRDNASGGLAISQQWEVLCPAMGKGVKAPALASQSGAGTAAAAANGKVGQGLAPPVDEYAVGQAVLAKYGSDWVRARVNSVRHSDGPRGPQTAYDVSLENGKRGVVPERMLRKAP